MPDKPSDLGQIPAQRSDEPAWLINYRVISALVLRESVTRFGRNNIGFLWLFVEPVLFTVVVTLVWTATQQLHRSSIPIAAFALTGYSSLLLWRNLPSRCIRALMANRSLLFHRRVKMLDVYVARCFLEIAGVTSSFVGLGIAFWALEMISPPEDVLKVLFAWTLLAWFGVGLALTLGALSEKYVVIEKLWSPTTLLLLPLSGVAFLVDALPPNLRSIVLFLPITHGVEMLRDGFFGSLFTAHYSIWYLAVWNVGLTLFGLSQAKRVGIGEGTEF